MKWVSIIGTSMMILAVLFQWSWFWLLLSISATIYALTTGRINFFEEISRANEPILYWIQISMLFFFDVYFIYELYF